MKLIFKTRTTNPGKKVKKVYLVRLPNYFDSEQVPELLQDVATNYLTNEQVIEHTLMGDAHITNDERKQLDIYGEIVAPPIELSCPELIRR